MVNQSPVNPAGNAQGSVNPLIASDLMLANLLQNGMDPSKFLWGQDKWGDAKFKVSA